MEQPNLSSIILLIGYAPKSYFALFYMFPTLGFTALRLLSILRYEVQRWWIWSVSLVFFLVIFSSHRDKLNPFWVQINKRVGYAHRVRWIFYFILQRFHKVNETKSSTKRLLYVGLTIIPSSHDVQCSLHSPCALLVLLYAALDAAAEVVKFLMNISELKLEESNIIYIPMEIVCLWKAVNVGRALCAIWPHPSLEAPTLDVTWEATRSPASPNWTELLVDSS